MIRPPPNLPLFPNPTLFHFFVRRAPDISYVLYTIGRGIDEVYGVRADGDNGNGAMIGRKPHPVHQQLALIERTEIGRQRIDRKSTRLNSSHLVISYAVFCLK